MISLVVSLDRNTILVSRATYPGEADARTVCAELLQTFPGIELWTQEQLDAWPGDQIPFPEKEPKKNGRKRRCNAVVLA